MGPRVGVTVDQAEGRAHLALGLSKLSSYQLRERARSLLDILASHEESVSLLETFLRDTVLGQPATLSYLQLAGVVVQERLLTREEQVRRVVLEEARRLTSYRRGADREIATRHAIAVVKRCNLQLAAYGDLAILSRALGCHRNYAKKVLEAVCGGTEETLFQRQLKRDCLLASHWPSLLRDFINRPIYSRYVPGNDSISLSYGWRVPKILLLLYKLQLLKEFLAENPLCPFKWRVLLREIPRNCACAGPRDFGRNCCVTHTNNRLVFEQLR